MNIRKKSNRDENYYVTAAMLRKRGACGDQVQLFERTFGKRRRVLLTLENIKKAQEADLDVMWPLRQAFWMAPCGSNSEAVALRLHRAAQLKTTPTEVLEALRAAPGIWEMVDKDRAALSEQQS